MRKLTMLSLNSHTAISTRTVLFLSRRGAALRLPRVASPALPPRNESGAYAHMVDADAETSTESLEEETSIDSSSYSTTSGYQSAGQSASENDVGFVGVEERVGGAAGTFGASSLSSTTAVLGRAFADARHSALPAVDEDAQGYSPDRDGEGFTIPSFAMAKGCASPSTETRSPTGTPPAMGSTPLSPREVRARLARSATRALRDSELRGVPVTRSPLNDHTVTEEEVVEEEEEEEEEGVYFTASSNTAQRRRTLRQQQRPPVLQVVRMANAGGAGGRAQSGGVQMTPDSRSASSTDFLSTVSTMSTATSSAMSPLDPSVPFHSFGAGSDHSEAWQEAADDESREHYQGGGGDHRVASPEPVAPATPKRCTIAAAAATNARAAVVPAVASPTPTSQTLDASTRARWAADAQVRFYNIRVLICVHELLLYLHTVFSHSDTLVGLFVFYYSAPRRLVARSALYR